MGPRRTDEKKVVAADVPGGTIVLAQAKGHNVIDVDSNRYVDFACGFGSLLLGHNHESLERALSMQSPRLIQGLGDVYPSDAKIGLLERLARFHSDPRAQVILGQSGADAVTAAIKSAVLHTQRSALVAFGSAYHGLSYGALSVTNLRPGYRDPFEAHLPQDVTWIDYPAQESDLEPCLSALKQRLQSGDVAAVIVEPILGRGGVIVPPLGFLSGLAELAHQVGTLVISDEIWTGLGRTGRWLAGSIEEDFRPDLICLGKGLGGGLPISATVGSFEVMSSWSQEPEVVHTSTFAGAPLACTAALSTLDVLGRKKWIETADQMGNAWIQALKQLMQGSALGEIRGRGFMIGMDAGRIPGGASALQRALLERGFITTTGGGKRDVLVLTPALNVSHDLLMAFEDSLKLCVQLLASGKARR